MRTLALSILMALPAAAQVPSPTAHLGYRPGADDHLVGWTSVVDYFRQVDAASDRVATFELGKSTEGRPYIVAVVSAPETIADLGGAKAIQRAVADPRIKLEGVDPASRGKTVVLVTCSIHSNETASTFMAMELLHDLATGVDAATREVLANTILLLVPSANPDGVDKVADWYARTRGKPWEGSGMPELYHKYAGHDTNRDWFMLNLAETKLLTRLLYKEWFPTLTYDVHQMGPRGARLFVPPFHDPINPNLDARIHQGIALIGSHMAADLAAAGKKGVLTNAMYDNWWNGGNRTTPQRHNMVGVLTEAASVRLASPIFVAQDELRGITRGFADHKPAVNFPDPWTGGWWRLRDIVDYELICARSILTLAARYRLDFQRNYRAMAADAIHLGETEPPFAWVVPADQADPGRAASMVKILAETGVEVTRTTSPGTADGAPIAEGSYVLRAAQPYRAHLKDMMERQVYPARFTAGGLAEAPYDVAGWTLPLQMGVRAVEVARPFEAAAEPLKDVDMPKGGIDGPTKADFFLIKNRANDDLIVLNALHAAGVPLERVLRPSRVGGTEVAADSLLFAPSAEAREVLGRLLPTISTRVAALTGEFSSRGEGPARAALKPRRVGVYQPWTTSMDEGWCRLVLERFQLPYTALHNAEIRAGGLRNRVDTILIPSIDAKALRSGHAVNETEPAFVGGLGDEGAAALREFVRAGGTLVCLEDSATYAIEALALPVRNVVAGLKTSEFYGPGSIVGATIEETSRGPLTAGMPAEFSAYFDRSLAFDLSASGPSDAPKVTARYAARDVLQSGWLLGPEKIQGKAAVLDLPMGKGRVVLFGFPPQHRGQTAGTFRLLMNALGMCESG